MKRAALFVGVNRYEDPEINNLDCAESDATELYAFFKHRAAYDDVRHLLSPDSDDLLDTAHDMAASLDPNDLFLFFFAGHGVEYEGRHLLLCSKSRYSRLKFHQHVVPLDLLKQETTKSGLHRVLILDACRTDLLKGERSIGSSGLRDLKCLKEMATLDTGAVGSLAILCSCDEGQQARELPQVKQGLFSRALLDALNNALSSGMSLPVSTDLTHDLASRMKIIASSCDITTIQSPWIQSSAGTQLCLIGESTSTVIQLSHSRGDYGGRASESQERQSELTLLTELLATDLAGLNAATRTEQKTQLQSASDERLSKWRRAAEYSLPEGMYLLGRYLANAISGDKKTEGIEWLRKAAATSYSPALYELGMLCEDDDPLTASNWYQHATDLGHKIAPARLGFCHLKGLGVKEDHAEAVRWFRLSAERGSDIGQLALAIAYLEGDGIPANTREGVAWLSKAAEHGLVKAQSILADCYWYGRGVLQDKKQALHWYKLAADKGDGDCCYSLGLAYLQGDGVDPDTSLGRLYLEAAAKQGVEAARVSLERRFGGSDDYPPLEILGPLVARTLRSIGRDKKLRPVLILLGCFLIIALICAAKDGHLVGVLILLAICCFVVFGVMKKLFTATWSAISSEDSNEESLGALLVLLGEHRIHRVFVSSANVILPGSQSITNKIVSTVRRGSKNGKVVVEAVDTVPDLLHGREVLLLWRKAASGNSSDATERMLDRVEVQARMGPSKALLWTGRWSLATKL